MISHLIEVYLIKVLTDHLVVGPMMGSIIVLSRYTKIKIFNPKIIEYLPLNTYIGIDTKSTTYGLAYILNKRPYDV